MDPVVLLTWIKLLDASLKHVTLHPERTFAQGHCCETRSTNCEFMATRRVLESKRRLKPAQRGS
jgi:hypothetical protein